MAVSTRGTNAPRAPATRPKAVNRSKASSKSKTASRTTSTSKTARKTPALPNQHIALEISATPSSGMASPDLIKETDIEASDDSFRASLAEARGTQPSTDRANTCVNPALANVIVVFNETHRQS